MRKLFIVISVLVVLSLSGCAAVPSAVSAVANMSRSAAPVAQAQATAVTPSTQGTDQAGSTTTTQQAAPVAQNVPAGIIDIQNTLSNLYSAVSPSVVNINVLMSATPDQGALPSVPNLPGLPFGGQGGQDGQGNPGGFSGAALGSGFVWDNQGHIVTNNHVVDGATNISVTFSDGLTLPAKLVGRDPDSEVAVIQVDASKVNNLHPVTLGDSTQVKPGQFVIAIGNPFGLEGTMTFGIVSALGRSLPVGGGAFSTAGSYTIPDIIQTDAPVNPGNSGGVLVDMTGRVVGIPTAIESQTGSSAGIGFVVPSVIVQQIVPQLISSGKASHPYIGIRGGTLTSQVAEAMKLPATTRGALVVEVSPGSPAERAALKGSTTTTQIDGLDAQIGGDVITAINGQPVHTFDDLTTYLARATKVGDQVNLSILRNGTPQGVTVTLAERPAQAPTAQGQGQFGQGQNGQGQGQGQTQPQPGGVYLGVTGMTVTPDVAQAMKLNNAQGVLVINVVPGSPAENAGLKGSDTPVNLNGQQMMVGGDVITAVDGKNITTVEELVAAVQAKNAGDTMSLTILRNGQQQTLTATLAARNGATGQGGSTGQATPQAQATPQTQAPATQAPTTQAPSTGATPGAGSSGGTTAPAAGGPWLGVNGVTVSAQIAQMMGLGNQTGVLLMNVVPGSPAEKAGLKGVGLGQGNNFVNADIITAIDGKNIATMDDLVGAIQAKQVGDNITLTVLRNGQSQQVQVTLDARPNQ